MTVTALRAMPLVLITMLFIGACGAPAAQTPPTPTSQAVNVTLAGSGGGTTILTAMVKPFQSTQPLVTLEFLQGSGGAAAKKGVTDGTLDIGILLSADIASEQQDGIEIVSLGEDPVSFVVHAGVPIKDLKAEQLRAIYLGQITNWRELGGPDAQIMVLTRDEDEGSTKVLRKVLFGDAAWAPSAVVLTKASDMRDALAKTPHSIGFTSYGDLIINQSNAQAIAVDGVHPKDYASGRYPIPARTLAIIYTSQNRSKVQPLLDYLLTDVAKAELQKSGGVPAK
jgi:phosphate transport system substrate-binding protein